MSQDRRAFFGAFGAVVGGSALTGCTDSQAVTTSTESLMATPVHWVDSVMTDLRACAAGTSCIGARVVIARGFASPDDGGGGIFSWDPIAATGDDGGTIIVPSVGGGRWKRIYSGPLDIRWFGAVAGSPAHAAANVTALERAIAVAAPLTGVHAGRVLVPAGQWCIDRTITLHQVDSVILTTAGGAGTWGAAGAYGHHSAKLLWCGGAAPMLELSSTMRCRVEGLMVDGGGVATTGIRFYARGNPAKSNLFDDLTVSNLGPDGIAVHIGDPGDQDIVSNVFRRLLINGCRIGVLQESDQTVENVHEDCGLYAFTEYGMKFVAGDATVSRCLFTGTSAARADVHVAQTALYARFVGNYHEVEGNAGYEFEPTRAGAIRPHATVLIGVRLQHNRVVPDVRRMIDFQQDGHLTLVSCEFDGNSKLQIPAEVYLRAPDVGWTDLGLIQEIGCRYLNGAFCTVETRNGAYTSLYSNGNPRLPAAGPTVGEHLLANTRLRVHNGEVVVQDNHAGDPLGTRLSSYFGELTLDTLGDAARGNPLLVIRNHLVTRFRVNAGGGADFYGSTTAPTSRPTITGSRGGNDALASLLSVLASFGLITDDTTA